MFWSGDVMINVVRLVQVPLSVWGGGQKTDSKEIRPFWKVGLISFFAKYAEKLPAVGCRIYKG